MKKIILSVLILATGTSFAQTFKFTLSYSDASTGDSETTYLEVFQAPNKLAAKLTEEGVIEYMYADNSLKKVLELLDEDDVKEAYISSWETDLFEEALLVSYASDICLLPIAVKDQEYRLLTETKTIQGLSCQKVEMLSEGEVIGTGWIAKGVFIKLTDDLGMFLTPEGTIVECTINIDEETSTCTLTSYSKTVADPAAAFNMNVPAGYEIIDDSEESGDVEDYGDEEGE